ncbi:MAG: Z1 domain-containing protein [Metamycoplasmataceae bacterium]
MKIRYFSDQLSPFDIERNERLESIIFIEKSKQSKKINFNSCFEGFLEIKKEKAKKYQMEDSDIEKDISKLSETINNVKNKIKTIDVDNILKLLVVGNVQSGKTDFMVGMISKLIDEFNNSSNIFIVLTTPNSNLLKQTNDRFSDIIFEITNNISLYNFSQIKKEGVYQDVSSNIDLKKNILIFLQKQKNHLEKGSELLNKLSMIKNKINKVVIFDDEGDATSFDNIFKEEQSTINKNITNMIKNTKVFGGCYISVTATPFVQMLVNEENNLKPKFGFVLEPGTGYVGLKEFSNESEKENSKIMKIINNEDFDINDNEDIKLALVNYFVQCYIFYKNKSFNNRKPRMLFNVKREISSHIIIKSKIENWLSFIKKNELNLNEILKNVILDYKEYIDLENELDVIQNFIINEVFNKLDIHEFNGNYNKNIELDKINQERYEIVIGSDKLGRGLTFIDLTCAFILRRSKINSLADNVLQMARWFGYRNEYFKIMKIYLSMDLINDFNIINYSANEIFEVIRDYEKDGNSIENLPKIFPTEQTQKGFGATRKTAVKTFWEKGYESSYINCKYELRIKERPIEKSNELFLKRFMELFNNYKKYDVNNYPIYSFDSIQEFNQDFFPKYSDSKIHSEYKNIFGLPDEEKSWLNTDLVNLILNDKDIDEVVIRLINKYEKDEIIDPNNFNWKQRLLYISNEDSSDYAKFSKGNWGDYNLVNLQQKNTLFIDIIPVYVWTKNELIKINNPYFTRARIFIPKHILKDMKTGLRAK